MTDERASRFSLVAFVLAALSVGVGAAAGLQFVPVAGSYVGILLGGLLAGLGTGERPLVEAGLVGALASIGIIVAGPLLGGGVGAAAAALGAAGPVALLISAVLSFAVGAFGAHFGDDLRDGITEPVEEPATGSSRVRSPAAPTEEESSQEGEREVDPTNAGAESAGTGQAEPRTTDDDTDATEGESADLELERE